MGIERRRTGNNDEPGHNVCEEATKDHIEPGGLVLARGYAFFHDGGLQVKLHPGGNGRANHSDQHVNVVFVPKQAALLGYKCRFNGFSPTRPGQHAGDDVADVKKRRRYKNLFYALVVAFDHQQPDHCR